MQLSEATISGLFLLAAALVTMLGPIFTIIYSNRKNREAAALSAAMIATAVTEVKTTVDQVHIQTNGMSAKIGLLENEKGQLQGRADEKAEEQQRQKDETKPS